MPQHLQAPTPKLILASASTARLSLLVAAGLRVEVRPSHIDETIIKQRVADHDAAAMLLAEAKAAALDGLEPNALILGADQILSCGGRRFDKPANLSEAASQLRALRGRPHVLHTALVCRSNQQTIWRHLANPRLVMRDISDACIEAYLAVEDTAVLTSVGAYRLEGPGIQLFETVEGDQAAILGLPLLPLLSFLREAGVLLA